MTPTKKTAPIKIEWELLPPAQQQQLVHLIGQLLTQYLHSQRLPQTESMPMEVPNDPPNSH